jgi:hypothetical protein
MKTLIQSTWNGGKTLKRTKKMMAGISTAALLAGMTGCNTMPVTKSIEESLLAESSNNSFVDGPNDPYCNEWEWEESGVYECEQHDSNFYGFYYYNGGYYPDKDIIYKKKHRTNSSYTSKNRSTTGNKNSNPSSNTSTSTSSKSSSNVSSSKSSNQSSTISSGNTTSSSSTISNGSKSTSSGFGSGSSSFGG